MIWLLNFNAPLSQRKLAVIILVLRVGKNTLVVTQLKSIKRTTLLQPEFFLNNNTFTNRKTSWRQQYHHHPISQAPCNSFAFHCCHFWMHWHSRVSSLDFCNSSSHSRIKTTFLRNINANPNYIPFLVAGHGLRFSWIVCQAYPNKRKFQSTLWVPKSAYTPEHPYTYAS